MNETTTKALLVSRKINKADKYINADWLKKLYDSIDNPRDKAYLMYHIETGLRVGDVVHTELVHVDWQNLKTYTYDQKKDQWRWVYWPGYVKPALKMWLLQRENEGIKSKYLFPFSEKTANRIIKEWCKTIDFPLASLVSSHWCRHTFIRLSRQAGRDISAVKQNTGDTYKTILEWYSGLNSDDMRHELESKPLLKSDSSTMEG